MAVPDWTDLLIGIAAGAATAVFLFACTPQGSVARRPALVVIAILLVGAAILGGVVVPIAMHRLLVQPCGGPTPNSRADAAQRV